MKKNNNQQLKAFDELVAMKYQIYNSLFLTLPFDDLENIGAHLSLLSSRCKDELEQEKTPLAIIQKFLHDIAFEKSFESQVKILFQILQFIEREVVLFDALEDASFENINDMKGVGTLDHLIDRVQGACRENILAEKLNEYKTRIVLTAHPTQFYPNSVLGIINDLGSAIKSNKLNEINDLLLQMGKTRFKNRNKPTPLDEARSLIWYLEKIFYETLSQIQNRLNDFLSSDIDRPHISIELGFWPGGDRDGNPFVTAETTRETAQLLKTSLINLYLDDIRLLKRRLTFDGIIDRLHLIEGRLEASQINQICHISPNVNKEQLKDLSFLPNLHSSPYFQPAELVIDLKEIRKELIEKHQSLFLENLDLLIIKVQIFGFYFASLDLRQDSSIHIQTMNEIFPEYSSLAEDQRISFLKEIILGQRTFTETSFSQLSSIAKDTINSLRAAQDIQAENGQKALHRYVISNTQTVSNIFEVMAFANLSDWKLDELTLDIVPLFETVNDLINSEEVMETLYSDEIYRQHLAKRGNTQTIMLGFSDGTKDGGYLTANWFIYKAKQKLKEISIKYNIKVIFFDGRGGPPARGGGNTHKFYRSLGKKIDQEQIHLTIQGQTISSNFGTMQAAKYNFEQLFTAGLEQKVFPESAFEMREADFELMENLSEISHKTYMDLRNHELFLPYLEEVTPLKYYGLLNIGSRPLKRNQENKSLRFEDLRAIPFVGAWTQMKQNIPGFYGLGRGLNELARQGKMNHLRELYKNSLFFRTLLENAMQSLCKSYFPLTHYLQSDPKFGDFWKLIYEEALLAEQLLKEISGQRELLENSAAIRESIRLREKIVLPLLTVQHYAMGMVKRIKENTSDYPENALEIYTKMIIKSLAANVNASRNSV